MEATLSTTDPYLQDLLEELEDAAARFAERHDCHFTGIVWDRSVTGAEYRDGEVVLGWDILGFAERASFSVHDLRAWWEIARVICHELFHGRYPRAFGAVEEAAVERLARHHVMEFLALVRESPTDAPPAHHWRDDGVYRPQVRWLERLAGWLGITSLELAWQIKDGHSGRRRPEAAQEATLARMVCEHLQIRLGRERRADLGRRLHLSAGSVNEGPHIPPRSPARAARNILNQVGRS